LNKEIVSAYAIGFGGVAEAIAKMSFGNRIGYELELSEQDLFSYSYGSILVESTEKLDFGEYLGQTSDKCIINDNALSMDDLYRANTLKYTSVYKDRTDTQGTLHIRKPEPMKFKYDNGPKIPTVYIPDFPGTNSNYDTVKAFERVGAKVTTSVFENLTGSQVLSSIDNMAKMIRECDIFVLSGGLSAGDEPDGSAKYICNVLTATKVSDEINGLIKRKGLILGICNGFQALIKTGLLPYSELGHITIDSPIIFRNDINRHCSQMVTTRVSSTNSPWLKSFKLGETFVIPVSHGEGKLVVSGEIAKDLFENGQVAFQYADDAGNPTMASPMNPNGSCFAIEGMVSKDGLILGKMGHSERYEDNLYKNIYGNRRQDIFKNAMGYFQNN
ncbi:MAG TPA: phosphoribosylformylglycinamidine synthase subunit PurQ, partial [Bacillota bacterium]|nr:phosphoribosylformylglycinamidine synthase subunit PurQ [Bacillota bacterium]